MRSARIKLHKFPLPWKPCAFQIFVEWNLSAQFVLIGANLCGLTRRGVQDVGSKKKKKKSCQTRCRARSYLRFEIYKIMYLCTYI